MTTLIDSCVWAPPCTVPPGRRAVRADMRPRVCGRFCRLQGASWGWTIPNCSAPGRAAWNRRCHSSTRGRVLHSRIIDAHTHFARPSPDQYARTGYWPRCRWAGRSAVTAGPTVRDIGGPSHGLARRSTGHVACPRGLHPSAFISNQRPRRFFRDHPPSAHPTVGSAEMCGVQGLWSGARLVGWHSWWRDGPAEWVAARCAILRQGRYRDQVWPRWQKIASEVRPH